MSDKPGLVYVIYNAAWPGWVKVGHVLRQGPAVERAMQKRVSNYNVADPHKGFIVSTSHYAACALVAEQFAHDLLEVNHRRGAGEWFFCGETEARHIVESACAIARLRPTDRGHHFSLLLEEERTRVRLDDTQIFKQMIDEDAASMLPKKIEVVETARAAHAVIEALLDQMAMSDENTEVAARAVMRRLGVLGEFA